MTHYRLSALLILFAAVTWANTGIADDPKPKTEFAFDPATIPPRVEGDGIVARCFQRQIKLADLGAKSVPLDNEASRNLQGLILGELIQRIAEQEKIQPQPQEVEEFCRVVLGKKLDAAILEGDLSKNPSTAVGAMFVKNWKIDRLLYQRYGGTVIFQQGNPREPVGAYRKLLEEAERAKVFETYDPEGRKSFWNYFNLDHPGVVPPEEIDYDKPWWLQEPGK